MKASPQPPRWADRLLEWFCAPHLLEEIQGDLYERFQSNLNRFGEKMARRKYLFSVLSFIRPFTLRRKPDLYLSTSLFPKIMLSNYFKIALRNLLRNRIYSFINIGGLAVGMAVAMLIGLWIFDELSFNKYHKNYDRIASVMQHYTMNGVTDSQVSLPIPLANELRTTYAGNFKYVLLSSWTEGHTLSYGDRKFWKAGNYIEPEAPEMLSLKMLKGTRAGLYEPSSIMINASVAKALFGDSDPMDKIIKIDNQITVKVTGVYEDLPYNTQFNNLDYLAPWALNVAVRDWVKNSRDNWDNNSFQIFAQIADNADMDKVSAKIKNARLNNVDREIARTKPEVFLQPMSKWHLYSEFKNGINVGGRIQFVWLFGLIGFFVLLLACINFMNLSTARSEKRAKEVGIRKAIGSLRGQLISQFLSESLLVVLIAFALSLVLVQLVLPFFNEVADKKMTILWSNPRFWLLGISFSLCTGLLAGSYPAFYLSSFQPVKVLKGVFRVGRFAAAPRKIMVVLQFTVSVTLIIGTIIVFRQIQFAKNRPIGYSRNGLIYVQTTTADVHNHYEAIRNEFIKSGAVVEMAESESPVTGVWNNNGGFEWSGKDPGQQANFAVIGVTHEFGKTIGWQFKEGRDFSKEFSTDSLSLVLNEAAVKFMGLKNPVGETVREGNRTYKIIGVIKDMIMASPYEPVKQSLFYLSDFPSNFINIKINPKMSVNEALPVISGIFRKYNPVSPFNYKFADLEYARKFAAEERIGKLATFFAVLAIFISCLGLFGLASFVAEQRTKEIGIRKVLGATVFNLWRLLSKDFVVLVIISLFIAIPIAYYFMNNWLHNYTYRSEISWWIFAVSGLGALGITLLTVSYQAIKAALLNPVKSLKTE